MRTLWVVGVIAVVVAAALVFWPRATRIEQAITACELGGEHVEITNDGTTARLVIDYTMGDAEHEGLILEDTSCFYRQFGIPRDMIAQMVVTLPDDGWVEYSGEHFRAKWLYTYGGQYDLTVTEH